jgi:CysZ protein
MWRGLNPADFFRGVTYPFRGLKVLRQQRGLARYWVFPIVLTALAIVSSLVLSVMYHEAILAWIWPEPTGDGTWRWLGAALHWVARIAVLLGMGALLLFVCVSCSTVIAAPFNDALSAAIERRVLGQAAPSGSWWSFAADVLRTLALELTKLALYVAVMGPLWLLSWLVPGPGQVVHMVFGILFTVSYVALDYIDWPASRRRYSIKQRFSLFVSRPWLMLGFGVAAWACLFVPLLNLAFMPLSVAGGTLLFLDLESSGPEG